MTAVSAERTGTTAPNGVMLLAERPRRLGPVSRRLVTRLLGALALLVALGSVLTFAFDSPLARAGGPSLVFPGGGLLYDASPVAFAVSLAVFVLAIVLWCGASAWWGIPLVWLLAGIVAVLPRERPASLRQPRHDVGVDDSRCLWPRRLSVGTAVARFERTYRRKRARVPELNAYLAHASLPSSSTPVLEPTAFDSELLRWAHEMALQPLDRFAGFDWGEQFHGPTCARYQLNFLGWALSLYAVNYLPNSRAPIQRALSNLVEEHTDSARVGLLASDEPHRQLRREPRPDRARQHHAVGLPR